MSGTMGCLTEQQLARLALGLSEDRQLHAHLEQCEVCRAKLAEIGRMTELLTAAHSDLDRRHADSRARLLASLAGIEMAKRPAGMWDRLVFAAAGLSVKQQVAIGGAGISAIAAAILLFLILSSAGQLSAMERMARQLREVKSYSYKATWDVDRLLEGETERWISKTSGEMFWRAPDAWHEESKIVQFKGAQRMENTIEHFSETFPAGKDGMLIDYQRKTFLREANEPIGSKTYPLDLLRLVQENSGDVVRDLGRKEIGGRQARGFVMALKGAHEGQKFEPVDVWVDPATDLPMGIGSETKDASGTTVMRLFDFRWDIELDSKLFEVTPPEDYTDVTPPTDKRALAQISTALRLYAELSGGHYPPAEKFNSDAIREKMLKMAGFTGPPQASWKSDKKYQEIEQAKAGLDWIGRMVLNEPNAGYFGDKVSPQDKEKVLLWWLMGAQGYRVFYGDLQTKVVNSAEAAKLGLTDTPAAAAEDKQSAGKLSAIERMTKQLRELKSYRYQYVEHVTIRRKGIAEPGLVDMTQVIYWRAPGWLREELKIVLNGAVPAGYHRGQVHADTLSISRTDRPGILIDRSTKSFTREPALKVEQTGSGSLTYPVNPLRWIREEPGKVVRELGSKEIQGKKAIGYLMDYKGSDESEVELWLDAKTDFPLEAGWESKDETTTSVVRLNDFQWNVDLDPKLFDPTPPAGYTDITPPTNEKAIAQIASALKLYAELSGGSYPKIDTYKVNEKFDADAVYQEMLNMAGVRGTHDQKILAIQQAKPGLDWIDKILRARLTSGFQGSKIGPNDKDKVLLWWSTDEPDEYRVFYGDLRTESLANVQAQSIVKPHPRVWDEPQEEESKPAEKH